MISFAFHMAIKDYTKACVFSSFVSATLFIGFDAWRHHFEVNLGWVPFLLLFGFAATVPVALLSGFPIYLYRMYHQMAPPEKSEDQKPKIIDEF